MHHIEPPPEAEPSTGPAQASSRFSVMGRVAFFNKKADDMHGTAERNREAEMGERKWREEEMANRRRREADAEEGRRREPKMEERGRRDAEVNGRKRREMEGRTKRREMEVEERRPNVVEILKRKWKEEERKREGAGIVGGREVGSGANQHMSYAGQPSPPHAGVAQAGGLALLLGLSVSLANDSNCTGVIRWTGYLPGRPGLIAGVELVSDVCVCYTCQVYYL